MVDGTSSISPFLFVFLSTPSFTLFFFSQPTTLKVSCSTGKPHEMWRVSVSYFTVGVYPLGDPVKKRKGTEESRSPRVDELLTE